MQATDMNFPYPVLGMRDSILGKSPVVRSIAHIPPKERISEPYRWDFEIEIDNKDIISLVETGKAEYMCEVLCSATLLRDTFFSKSSKFTVEIGRKKVNKRIEFRLFVVAVEHLPEYQNANAHPDYQEVESFDIPKGAPLAILGSYHWDADLCYEDLTSLRSILRIVENEANPNEEFVHLDTDGDYIKLELPRLQYKAFTEVSANPEITKVLHSTIVLFALQGALAVYSPNKTHRWERAIEAMVSRDERFRDLELGQPADAAEIAVRLLGNPFKALGEVLPTLGAARGVTDDDSSEDGEDE